MERSIERDIKELRFEADPCLYVKTENGEEIYIVVYVDDILIRSKRLSKIMDVFLKQHFHLNDLFFHLEKIFKRHPALKMNRTG